MTTTTSPRHVLQGGRQRGLVTEVARELDADDAVVRSRGSVDQLERAVGAAVVDEHDLVRPAGEVVEHRGEAAKELREHLLLVVEGDRDRNAARGNFG